MWHWNPSISFMLYSSRFTKFCWNTLTLGGIFRTRNFFFFLENMIVCPTNTTVLKESNVYFLRIYLTSFIIYCVVCWRLWREIKLLLLLFLSVLILCRCCCWWCCCCWMAILPLLSTLTISTYRDVKKFTLCKLLI